MLDRRRILVVDDEPIVRQVVAGALTPLYDILVRSGGLGLHDALEDLNPDLIILDVRMPGINGLELCAGIRRHRRWDGLPILFLTACAKEEEVASGYTAGADSYLAKPFDVPDLRRTVAALLDPPCSCL